MNLFARILASIKMRSVKKRFETSDYLDAYTKSTDIKTSIDPAMAIGGLWEMMGRHQFEFLKQHGLRPEHNLLDIGCGSLRGGLFFIDYLDQGCYTGFDLSSEAIDVGRQKVFENCLTNKCPNLLVNCEKNLKFDLVKGRKFNFILAQSVFSHLQPDHIRECFENLHKVMHRESRFFFTHHPGEQYRQRSRIDFEYPISFFDKMASAHGFCLVNFSKEYRHPRGQNMLMVYREIGG